jgi:hypothetical protein
MGEYATGNILTNFTSLVQDIVYGIRIIWRGSMLGNGHAGFTVLLKLQTT